MGYVVPVNVARKFTFIGNALLVDASDYEITERGARVYGIVASDCDMTESLGAMSVGDMVDLMLWNGKAREFKGPARLNSKYVGSQVFCLEFST